jgi:hypothetical protein
MVTNEAHGDSVQQAIHLIKVGGIPCAGCAHHSSAGLIDHATFGCVICSGLALENRASLPAIEN